MLRKLTRVLTVVGLLYVPAIYVFSSAGYNIRFAGYGGMCKTYTFDGNIVLIKNYPNGKFKFFKDKDGDNCFDTRGEGFYMMGILKRISEDDIPNNYKNCL